MRNYEVIEGYPIGIKLTQLGMGLPVGGWVDYTDQLTIKGRKGMTDRERYLRTMSLQETDRFPFHEIGAWEQTLEEWKAQGLPEEEMEREGGFFKGGTKILQLDRREFISLNMGPIPGFYRVLEETDRYVIFTDSWGIKRRALKEGTVRGMRLSMDTYLDFPVKKRGDFLELKGHFDPGEPSRYPKNWDELRERWRNRDYPLYLYQNCAFGGLYWNLRLMMGTEGVSYAFYDQPKLVHEILDWMVEYFMEVTGRVFEALGDVEVDACIINEDFAHKTGPLISPKIYREFFLPRHRAIFDFLRRHGVKVIEFDSDGNFEVLIPMLIEAGVNCIWPLEAAAGMDPVKIRNEYRSDLAVSGGIDKRVLAEGKEAIEEELRRKIVPLLDIGGYIPTVDHAVQPGVPLENFLYYIELRRKIAYRQWK